MQNSDIIHECLKTIQYAAVLNIHCSLSDKMFLLPIFIFLNVNDDYLQYGYSASSILKQKLQPQIATFAPCRCIVRSFFN